MAECTAGGNAPVADCFCNADNRDSSDEVWLYKFTSIDYKLSATSSAELHMSSGE